MKITTYQFGDIEFDENSIINFEKGLFGFENLTKFILLHTDENVFFWFNSIDEPEITFPMVNLRMIDDSYPVNDSLEVFGMATLNPDPLKITLNMKAPVYINQNDKTGYQTILDKDNFKIDYNLFVEE